MVNRSQIRGRGAVGSATNRRREAAVLVGAADTQRGSGSTSQRPPQPPDQNLRRSLIRGWDALPSTRLTPKADRCPPPRPSGSHRRAANQEPQLP
jgi:hypothetical protein